MSCKGCEYIRKYKGSDHFFCASQSRKDGIEANPVENIKSNTIWPFKIVDLKDIIECNGFVKGASKVRISR